MALPSRTAQDFMIEISPSGDYIVENYIPSGGSALMKWFTEVISAWARTSSRREKKKNTYIISSHRQLMPERRSYNLAARKPGSAITASVCCPSSRAANGPFWDLKRPAGLLFGLHTDHGRPENSSVLSSRGLAYERPASGDAHGKRGRGPRSRRSCKMYGGSSVSDHWNQAFSDVCSAVPVNSRSPTPSRRRRLAPRVSADSCGASAISPPARRPGSAWFR